jgi:putative hemolysin
MDVAGHSIPIAEIISICACLISSAFFSGTETALTHLSETRCRQLLESDPRKYGVFQFWLNTKNRILAALLVGNNLVNILCSVLAYRVALRFLPDYAEAISVFGLTIVILIFAEITPKSLALHYAERVAVPLLRIVWLVDKLFWVVTTPLTRIPEFILRTTNLEEDPGLTEDDIEYQIRLGHDQAVFEEQAQGDLLMSAVEFSETTVREVLVPRTEMFGLEVNTPSDEAVDAVMEKGHSRIPIYQADLDHILGLLHAKDLIKHLKEHGDTTLPSIEGLIRKPPLFAPETQKISELLTKMRRRGTHMAIAVDEFGGTAGLVTLEDIIEELVGEIRDEFDPHEAPVRRIGVDTWVIDARLSIGDLKDATDIELPESTDYESVGGFVVTTHGNIPLTGTNLNLPGMQIKVLASDARHVERVELKLVPDRTPEDAE